MRLTWRDAIATAVAGLVAAVAPAVTRSWDWPLLGWYRGGVGVPGFSACRCASSEARDPRAHSGPFVVLASTLGGLALLLILIGLITGTEMPFIMLAVDIEILWAATTLRHGISARQGLSEGRAASA